MNRPLLLLTLLSTTAIAATGIAQDLRQGSIYVQGEFLTTTLSGTSDWSGDDEPVDEVSTFTLAPTVGYFVTNEISAELAVDYGHQKVDAHNAGGGLGGLSEIDYDETTSGLRLQGLYHFPVTGQLSGYGLGALGVTKYNRDGDLPEINSTLTLLGAGAGLMMTSGGRRGALMRFEARYDHTWGEVEVENILGGGTSDYDTTLNTFSTHAWFGVYF